MFLKKNVLFVLMVGFFVAVLNGINFSQETEDEDDEEEIIEVDTTEAYIPANYQPCELVREFGVWEFKQASQFAFSPDGKVVYCADATAYRVLAYNCEGGLLFSFGGQRCALILNPGLSEEAIKEQTKEYEESMVGRIGFLMGISVDKTGNVYVADHIGNSVKVYTSEGKFVLDIPAQIDLQKKSPGNGVSGVAINSRGDIYITDNSNDRIQVNDLNGKYKYQITKFKNKEGKELDLVRPAHPAVNSLDEVYVICPLICRVHRFDVDGNYLGGFGYMGDGAGGFNAPNGLAIDKLDRVYVSDCGFSVIQVFSKEGKFLYALCNKKGKRLEIPFVGGVGIGSDNLIYVSVLGDNKGAHVRVFKYLTK